MTDGLRVAGYVRVSTDDQDAERQRDAIERAYSDADIEWYQTSLNLAALCSGKNTSVYAMSTTSTMSSQPPNSTDSVVASANSPTLWKNYEKPGSGSTS